MINKSSYIFLLIILYLLNSHILFGQKKYEKSWRFVKNIIEQDKLCNYTYKEISDSSFSPFYEYPKLLVYCKDTSATLNGGAYVCEKNGYYFYGNYLNGEKDGIWTLYKCSRKNKIVKRYLYKKDVFIGIVYNPKKKQKRLNYIPSVIDMF